MRLDKSAGPFRRALEYAFYDWTREMPKSKRLTTWVGVALQGYSIYVLVMWAFGLPKPLSFYFLALPKSGLGYLLALLFYYAGGWPTLDPPRNSWVAHPCGVCKGGAAFR